jgi:hypothetical protein
MTTYPTQRLRHTSYSKNSRRLKKIGDGGAFFESGCRIGCMRGAGAERTIHGPIKCFQPS